MNSGRPCPRGWLPACRPPALKDHAFSGGGPPKARRSPRTPGDLPRMNPTWMLTLLVGLSAACMERQPPLAAPQGRAAGRPDRSRGARAPRRARGSTRSGRREEMELRAGLAHKLIFIGFLVLLLRSADPQGRGFCPSIQPADPGARRRGPAPGRRRDARSATSTSFVKDICVALVLFGALVFIYYRAISAGGRADDALGRGRAHPRDHRDDDGAPTCSTTGRLAGALASPRWAPRWRADARTRLCERIATA